MRPALSLRRWEPAAVGFLGVFASTFEDAGSLSGRLGGGRVKVTVASPTPRCSVMSRIALRAGAPPTNFFA